MSRKDEVITDSLKTVMQVVSKEVEDFHDRLPDDPLLKVECFDSLVFNLCVGLVTSASLLMEEDKRLVYIINLCNSIKKSAYEISEDNEDIKNIVERMNEDDD